MTLGEIYVKELKECGIETVSYEKAVEISKMELRNMGISQRTDVYDNDDLVDNPIYPANAELYDEFVENYGFDVIEYCLFIAKRIEIDN